MASKKEIDQHLKMALEEIGSIKPKFDKRFKAWIFGHKAYPVEYAGKSPEEVIRNYPKHLREFIKQRLNDNLSPWTEKQTKGRGGKREGAGRPKGSKKEAKERVYLPKDIAHWIRHPEAISSVRQMIARARH